MKSISCLFVLVLLYAYVQAQEDNGNSVDSVSVGSKNSSQDGFTLGATVDDDSATDDSSQIAPATNDTSKNVDGYVRGQAYFVRCAYCDGYGYCFEQYEDYKPITACWNCKGNRLCYKHTERLNPVCVICGGHRRCYPAYYNHYKDCFKCNSKTICYKSEYIIPDSHLSLDIRRSSYPSHMN